MLESKVSYKRNINQNYMVLTQYVTNDDSTFEITMMEQNNLKGFLSFTSQQVNLSNEYWYDISCKQPISHMISKKMLNYQDIQLILIQLYDAFETLDNFLINVNNIILDPEYIYTEPDKLNLYFCYFPNNSISFNNSIKDLMRFLLDRVDHSDNLAVAAIYPIYNYCTTENFTIQGIMQLINPVNMLDDLSDNSKNIEKNELIVSNNNKMDIHIDKQPLKIKFNKNKCYILLSIALAILIFTLLLFNFINVDFKLIYHNFILIGLVLIFCLVVTIFYICERKHNYEINDNKDKGGESSISSKFKSEKKTANLENTIVIENVKLDFFHYLVSVKKEEYESIFCSSYPFTIGRLHGCDHIISNPYISRFHAQVINNDDKIAIKDLNSINGTYVNGKRLEPGELVILQLGDEIAFANICYKYI